MNSVVETMATTNPFPFPCEPANYDVASMQQFMIFSDSLKDLKNLRKQLHSAADYFEMSYNNDDQKPKAMDMLKDYAIKALVNTVDHLGSVTYKVDDFLDEKVKEISGTEVRLSCIEQRLRTCQDYIDREGLSQQSLVINTPNYHKSYILPAGKTSAKSNFQGRKLDNADEWYQFKNAIRAPIQRTLPKPIGCNGRSRSLSPSSKLSQQPGKFSFSGRDLERRAQSPHRFPFLWSGSLSSKPTTPKISLSSTPNPALARQQYVSDPRKSASMMIRVGKERPKESEEHPSKSNRLLKALLSRRKSKKDGMLRTYLDEY